MLRGVLLDPVVNSAHWQAILIFMAALKSKIETGNIFHAIQPSLYKLAHISSRSDLEL